MQTQKLLNQVLLLAYEQQIATTPSGTFLPTPPKLLEEDGDYVTFIQTFNLSVDYGLTGAALVWDFANKYFAHLGMTWSAYREGEFISENRGNLWREARKLILPHVSLELEV